MLYNYRLFLIQMASYLDPSGYVKGNRSQSLRQRKVRKSNLKLRKCASFTYIFFPLQIPATILIASTFTAGAESGGHCPRKMAREITWLHAMWVFHLRICQSPVLLRAPVREARGCDRKVGTRRGPKVWKRVEQGSRRRRHLHESWVNPPSAVDAVDGEPRLREDKNLSFSAT